MFVLCFTWNCNQSDPTTPWTNPTTTSMYVSVCVCVWEVASSHWPLTPFASPSPRGSFLSMRRICVTHCWLYNSLSSASVLQVHACLPVWVCVRMAVCDCVLCWSHCQFLHKNLFHASVALLSRAKLNAQSQICCTCYKFQLRRAR